MTSKVIIKDNYRKIIFYFSLLLTASTIYSSVAHVTVWVHGTHPLQSVLCSKYSPLRSKVYIPKGLTLAKDLPENYHAALIAAGCNQKNPEEYDSNHFYLFGWNSGNVRPKTRKQAGYDLSNSLNDLLDEYKKNYDAVKLRIIGFSHGGNVILNCMSHMPLSHLDTQVEVVLIATPIQESTRPYVNSPWVKKVYSFYSDADWIQRIDMQKFHSDAPKLSPLLSGRTFLKTDHVTQVALKINNKSIGHFGYRFMFNYIPDLLDRVAYLEMETGSNLLSLNFVTA